MELGLAFDFIGLVDVLVTEHISQLIERKVVDELDWLFE